MSQAGALNNKGGGGGGSPIMTVTGNSGGPVPPTANNVSIVGDGSVVTVTGNPGTSTLTISLVGGQPIDTIQGDTGSVSGAIVAFHGQPQAGSSVTFSGAGTLMSFNTTDANSNVIIGQTAGNATITGTNNVGNGYGSLHALTSGIRNAGLGYQTLNTLQTGNFNVAVGYNALLTDLSGSSNTAVGTQALTAVNTGAFNTALGYQAGQNYTTSESANISISNPGVLGESHVLRIGVTGSGTQQVNQAFIAGIDGVNVGSVARVVTEASDQLGTAIITAGTGITITPGANTITITSTAGAFAWSDQAVSFAAVKENGYFIIGTLTATLPAAPTTGDTIKFFVDGAFTLTIQASPGQTIKFATSVSSAGGTQVNTASGDSCELVYRAADTQWNCINFVGAWNHT